MDDTEELERQLTLLNAKATQIIELLKGLDYKAWVYMRAHNLLDEKGQAVQKKPEVLTEAAAPAVKKPRAKKIV